MSHLLVYRKDNQKVKHSRGKNIDDCVHSEITTDKIKASEMNRNKLKFNMVEMYRK